MRQKDGEEERYGCGFGFATVNSERRAWWVPYNNQCQVQYFGLYENNGKLGIAGSEFT